MNLIFLFVVLVPLFIAILNSIFWPSTRSADDQLQGKISILIPARNEEENLPQCLDFALKQGRIVLEILIYNDHSSDGTARVIGEYAARDFRVRAVDVLPLEAGWSGKNFACWQLANAARGELLLFIDADARLSDRAANRMAAELNFRKLTFLSVWPRLELVSFWESVLMPMLNFVVFATFPAPLSLLLNKPSLGLAHGACLMFERDTYSLLGGHSAVRDQIFEDTRLAQLWREKGQRGLCLDGQDLVRVRMYSSLAEIWKGFQKNFYPAFRHEVSFWFFLIFHFAVFTLPFLMLAVRPEPAIALAAAAVLLTRLVLSLRFHHPIWSVLLHPLAELILLALGLSSWRRCKTGRGVSWKGREYNKSA